MEDRTRGDECFGAACGVQEDSASQVAKGGRPTHGVHEYVRVLFQYSIDRSSGLPITLAEDAAQPFLLSDRTRGVFNIPQLAGSKTRHVDRE